MRNGKRYEYADEQVDYYDLVPEWTEKSACVGMWNEFDKDENETAAIICWSSCEVRRECLMAGLRRERESNRIYENGTSSGISTTGVIGGYTASERQVLHNSINTMDIDLKTV